MVVVDAPVPRVLTRSDASRSLSRCCWRRRWVFGDPFEGDPHQSRAWPELKREHFGANAKVVFDKRVEVQGPSFAEDPMSAPITVRVKGIADPQRVWAPLAKTDVPPYGAAHRDDIPAAARWYGRLTID